MDRAVKQQIRTLLMQRKYDRLIDLCQADKNAWKALRINLYTSDENLSWPTIEAIANLMQVWWHEGEKEKVREYIRRLFWSLNDESGGIGWNAPQTIAEIIVLIPELIDPYGSMMIDRTMEEPLLVQNGLWAIGRLGKPIEPAVVFFQGIIMRSFSSNDPQTLGLAAWAMGEVGFKLALSSLEKLVDRPELVRIYIQGAFHEKTVGEWAREAIDKIVRYPDCT